MDFVSGDDLTFTFGFIHIPNIIDPISINLSINAHGHYFFFH